MLILERMLEDSVWDYEMEYIVILGSCEHGNEQRGYIN